MNILINEIGIKEIHDFLASRHKLGGDHFDVNMLNAWAAEAENNAAEGNGATVEILSFDSVSGHAETYEVSDSGYEEAEE